MKHLKKNWMEKKSLHLLMKTKNVYLTRNDGIIWSFGQSYYNLGPHK